MSYCGFVRFVSFVVLALVSSLGVSCGSSSTAPSTPKSPPVEVRSEVSIDGSFVEFPRRGRVTLIDFWATSCDPCMAIIPRLEELWKQRRDDGLDIIGVAADDNPGLVLQTLERLGVTYRNILDAQGVVRGDYHVDAVPHAVVVDRRGQLRLSVQGGSVEDLDRVLEEIDKVLDESL